MRLLRLHSRKINTKLFYISWLSDLWPWRWSIRRPITQPRLPSSMFFLDPKRIWFCLLNRSMFLSLNVSFSGDLCLLMFLDLDYVIYLTGIRSIKKVRFFFSSALRSASQWISQTTVFSFSFSWFEHLSSSGTSQIPEHSSKPSVFLAISFSGRSHGSSINPKET